MAYIRRWVGRFILALFTTVLLSACGSQEVKFDNQIITPALTTPASKDLIVLDDVLQQQDTFSLEEFAASSQLQETKDQHTARLIKFVASRFKKPESLIEKIVSAAQRYSSPNFPTTEDILAIIAVESTFNTNARHNGSWGLMQIEAKSHRARYKGESLTNIDTNIRVGTEILTEYFGITHSQSDAIMAYNVGINGFIAGRHNKAYMRKVEREKQLLELV
jgi:hypothetical protein